MVQCSSKREHLFNRRFFKRFFSFLWTLTSIKKMRPFLMKLKWSISVIWLLFWTRIFPANKKFLPPLLKNQNVIFTRLIYVRWPRLLSILSFLFIMISGTHIFFYHRTVEEEWGAICNLLWHFHLLYFTEIRLNIAMENSLFRESFWILIVANSEKTCKDIFLLLILKFYLHLKYAVTNFKK